MTLRVDFDSSHGLTLHTSSPSWTPSSERSPLQAEVATPILIAPVEPQNNGPELRDIAAAAAVIVAVLAIVINNNLSKKRDREKTVLDFQKNILKDIEQIRNTICDRWNLQRSSGKSSTKAETEQKIAMFLLQLQNLGANIRLLEIISRRRVFRWFPPGWPRLSVQMARDVATLRDTLTADPFDDPVASTPEGIQEKIDVTFGTFTAAMATAIADWFENIDA